MQQVGTRRRLAIVLCGIFIASTFSACGPRLQAWDMTATVEAPTRSVLAVTQAAVQATYTAYAPTQDFVSGICNDHLPAAASKSLTTSRRVFVQFLKLYSNPYAADSAPYPVSLAASPSPDLQKYMDKIEANFKLTENPQDADVLLCLTLHNYVVEACNYVRPDMQGFAQYNTPNPMAQIYRFKTDLEVKVVDLSSQSSIDTTTLEGSTPPDCPQKAEGDVLGNLKPDSHGINGDQPDSSRLADYLRQLAPQ